MFPTSHFLKIISFPKALQIRVVVLRCRKLVITEENNQLGSTIVAYVNQLLQPTSRGLQQLTEPMIVSL